MMGLLRVAAMLDVKWAHRIADEIDRIVMSSGIGYYPPPPPKPEEPTPPEQQDDDPTFFSNGEPPLDDPNKKRFPDGPVKVLHRKPRNTTRKMKNIP